MGRTSGRRHGEPSTVAGKPYAFDFANQRVGGDLAERLRAWRADEVPYVAIRDELASHGVHVAVETIRRWVLALEPQPETAA